jgi:hypothetical protein
MTMPTTEGAPTALEKQGQEFVDKSPAILSLIGSIAEGNSFADYASVRAALVHLLSDPHVNISRNGKAIITNFIALLHWCEE